MIDLHCHILPGIDDGARTMEESVKMAHIAQLDGIRAIIATPHVYQGNPSMNRIAELASKLRMELKNKGIKIKIFSGAEIAFPAEIKDIESYSINGTKSILIEFPHSHLPINSVNYLKSLVSKGFLPIIAHPERNPSVVKNPSRLFDLIEAGAGVQITASSITGGFGREIQSLAFFLLKKKAVHFIASDSHGTGFRKPLLSPAIKYAEKLAGREYLQRLTYENPLRILEGRRAL